MNIKYLEIVKIIFILKKKVQKGKIEYFIRKKIKLAYVTNIVDMNRRKIRISVMENMKIV